MARDETQFRRDIADFFANPAAAVGLSLLGLIVAVAIAAPFISPQNPYELARFDALHGNLPPGSTAGGGGTFWLGSDQSGRDVLSAILYGLRISLAAGVVSALIALAIGLATGLTAACWGGRTARLIMRIAEIQLSFPALLIALVVLVVLGPGLPEVIAALVTVQWAYYARAVRDRAWLEKHKPYIEATRCLALSPTRMVVHHLLPNCLPPLVVVAGFQVAAAITLEATLSFLGLGVQANDPSLGLLVANGFHDLLTGRYWISFFPGIALLLTILSFNLVANQLRDLLNARPQQ